MNGEFRGFYDSGMLRDFEKISRMISRTAFQYNDGLNRALAMNLNFNMQANNFVSDHFVQMNQLQESFSSIAQNMLYNLSPLMVDLATHVSHIAQVQQGLASTVLQQWEQNREFSNSIQSALAQIASRYSNPDQMFLSEKTLREITGLSGYLNNMTWYVQEDGGVETGQGTIVPEEIQVIVDETLNRIWETPGVKNLNDFLISFVNIIKTHGTSAMKFGVIVVLLVLLSRILPMISNHSDQTKNYQEKQVVRILTKIVVGNLEQGQIHELVNWRIISTRILEARLSSSKKSGIVEKLPLGKLVTVVQKKRNWSKVIWVNQEGETREGWVFTRYLKKLT